MATRVLVVLLLSACAPAPPPAPPKPVVISEVREAEPPKPKPAPTQPIDAVVDSKDPREALKAFLSAYEQKQYDVLMGFVPAADRAGLTEEKLKAAWEGPDRDSVEKSMRAMRSVVDSAPMDVQGNRASMAYGAGGTVSLVKADGVWKIEDF